MTVTGFKAPHGRKLHRPYALRISSATITRTYCGIDLPGDGTWDETAQGKAYDCRQCQTAWDSEQNARRPWNDVERRTYTQKRHPGLHNFLADYSARNVRIGSHWRLRDHPRVSFRTSRDERAPQGRRWRLCTGMGYDRCIGYFTTTTEAVDFTRQVEAAGLLVQMLNQVDTDAWDERTTTLTFLASAQPKETNPA